MSSYQRKLPVEVEAIRLIRPVYDQQGNIMADRGEWILTDGKEQYYMKNEDFQKEFVKKGPEIKHTHSVSVQTYPIYVEKPVPYPCPSPWIRPYWERGTVWCNSEGYLKRHS